MVANGGSGSGEMAFDTKGRLLVVYDNDGIYQYDVTSNGCTTSSRVLVEGFYPLGFTHSLYFSPDGRTLYASGEQYVYRWQYVPETGALSAKHDIVVRGMGGSPPIQRPVAIIPDRPDLIVVASGIDRAMVKVFNISQVPRNGYLFSAAGWLGGSGLAHTGAFAFDDNKM